MPSGYPDTTQALLYSQAHWTIWLDSWCGVAGVQRSFLLQSRICDCSQFSSCLFYDWRFSLYCHLSKWSQLYLVSNSLHNIHYCSVGNFGVWQPAFTTATKISTVCVRTCTCTCMVIPYRITKLNFHQYAHFRIKPLNLVITNNTKIIILVLTGF